MNAEERAARRALLRAHHPDLGGDTETFVAVMSALESPVSLSDAPEVRAPRGARRRRAAVRRARGRLPRVLPGARRYATY